MEAQKIARERMDLLYAMAIQRLESEPELSKRYIRLAREIGMRHSISLRREQKRWLCPSCGLPLLPGLNCRVRISNKRRLIICSCGHPKVLPLREKQESVQLK